jgi:hypothetical protein
VDVLCQKRYRCYTIILSTHRVNINRRRLHKIVYAAKHIDVPYENNQFYCSSYKYTKMTDSFHCCNNSSLFRMEILSVWVLDCTVPPPN